MQENDSVKSFKNPKTMKSQFRILILPLVSLCLHAQVIRPAFAADTVQTPLALGEIGQTPLGALPPGWTAVKGDWAVRLDQQFAPEGSEEAKQALPLNPELEKESLLPCVLGTDLVGGSIRYDGQSFADFTFTYQMKHATERDYWSNEFRFRIQPKGDAYYMVRHDRNGTFSLLRGKEVLATSEGKLDVGQGEWLWVRVQAEGNRIRVWGCTDGVSFFPFLDVTDAGGITTPGKVALAGPRRFRFAFLENPWNNDTKKKSAGAWLTSVQQAQGFRQRAGDKQIRIPLSIEYFVSDPSKAPKKITISCKGRETSLPLGESTLGYHHLVVFAEIPNEATTDKVDVVLSRDKVMDKATVQVTNPFDASKLVAANPNPGKPLDDASLVTKADYMACLDKAFERYGNSGRFGWDNRWGQEAELYKATGAQKHLDRVMEWVRTWISDRTSGKRETPDFHFANRPGFAEAATLAIEKGNLTPEERKIFLSIVADVLATNQVEGGGVMNRAMGYAVPIKPLLKLVPDHPMRKQLVRYHDAIMADFMATKEVLENSSNYMPITALYLIAWIDQNGLQELYQDPKLKACFENLLQMMDPSGGIPQFADYGGKDLYDWKLVAVFERLAAVYKDGRFKWAAHEMARHLIARFNVETISGGDTESMASAFLYADDSIAEVRPSSGSVVLTRNTGHLDKLILRSGWEAKDFFAAVDLLSGCEHGDAMALALISTYNDGGQSLIDKAGRDIANHSVPLVRESASEIPYLPRFLEPGRWYQASFDLKLFQSWGNFSGGAGSPLGHQYLYGEGMIPYDFTYNPSQEFAFALGLNGNGKVRISLDNVKLVKSGASPDKPAKEFLLEDFEGPAYRWIGNFQKADGGTNGKSCGRFEVDFSESHYIGKKFPMPLYVYDSDYDRIDFNFKIEPVTGDVSGMVLTLGDKSGTPRNYALNLNQNHPVKQKFFQDGKLATFAGFTLEERTPFGGPQTREREFLFVKNKILWIRDRITTDPARPYAAGPIWQVGNLSPAHGANWFDTWIDTNLMFWFVPKPYAAIETISDPQPRGYEMGWKKQYPAVLTQYANGKKGGGSLVFDTLLLPHKRDKDASEYAKDIKVLHDQNDITLISVDGDLLLCNPTGKKVELQGLTTDCKMLYATGLGTDSPACEGEGGTYAEYQGKKLDLQAPLDH